jgi:nitroimidazol reductase NimA-like FMN-containing flavoprotein (pyridoxamine 5'-phosphate oxidase superfamily)
MPIPKELSLTEEELADVMSSTWNMRIATIGPGTRINMTPLWFVWVGGKIYTYCRGQKVANLRRNSRATILVDRNEKFPELMGAMFQGKATVLEDAAAEAADVGLEEARVLMGSKYAGGHGGAAVPARNESTARGRNWRWVVFTPDRIVTWDNHKLAALRR